MKAIVFLFLAMLPEMVFAQSGDGGSGWANWILNQAEWVKNEVRENEQIAKTVELIKIYKETQQLTGIVASTVTDLKNATLKFQDDVQTIDDITQSQLEQLNNYFSWDDALTGRGYPSLLNIEQWYTSETSTFRDREGHLNAVSLLFNTISVEDQARRQKSYYATLVRIRGQKGIYLDREISRLLHLSKEYDNQARHLVIKLNLTVFNQGMDNIQKGLGKVFKGEKESSDEDKKKTKRSEAEIQAQIQQVYDLQDKASQARGEALDKLYELMRMDMNSTTLDLLAWRRLNGKNSSPPNLVVPEGFINAPVIGN